MQTLAISSAFRRVIHTGRTSTSSSTSTRRCAAVFPSSCVRNHRIEKKNRVNVKTMATSSALTGAASTAYEALTTRLRWGCTSC
jgi:hypothetical protein